MLMEKTFILYHGSCPDGFGGAYSAWKKFGDTATYVPLKHNVPPPELPLDGAIVYFIDFCYTKEVMDTFVTRAGKVVVLDHHVGVQEITESMPEYVFDNDRSGATIAWSYFHPDTPVPTFLTYVQEGDLFKFDLPDTRPILTYAYSKPFEFSVWDTLVAEIESPEGRARVIEKGRIYSEYFLSIADNLIKEAVLVEFEGYTCYFVSATSQFGSEVGNRLAKMHPPLALVASVRDDSIRISLRSDGTVDVAEIARKYGGNGHKAASGFSIPFGAPIPWKKLS